MPLRVSPSSKINSPFLTILDILQFEILTNSSLDKLFKELSCLVIHCSHLPIVTKVKFSDCKIKQNSTNIIFSKYDIYHIYICIYVKSLC